MKTKQQAADVGIVVGRFQVPYLHQAHLDLIQTVVNNHPKVIIFLGLSPLKVTRNNPLDFEARKQMILEKFPNVSVLYIKDTMSDKVWSRNLDERISDVVGVGAMVTLYGGRDSFIKHYTGRYNTQELEPEVYISGSELRKEVSAKVKASADFRAGVIWAAMNQYPKVNMTTDIIVVSEDGKRVLLGRKPHEELHRMVGGFTDPKKDKSLEDCAKRETQEETGLEVTNPVYIGSTFVDDWRYKSEDDKIITALFVVKHVFGAPVPNDDIAEVKWFDIATLKPEQLVTNHRILWTLFENYIVAQGGTK